MKGQVTFLEPFPGVPSHLDYTQKLANSILALKLSVTTYFHWVTTTLTIKRCPKGIISIPSIFLSVPSEICRIRRIQVGCTHTRTNKNHHNAFLCFLTPQGMHCCGPDLFTDGCNEIQCLGPHTHNLDQEFSV